MEASQTTSYIEPDENNATSLPPTMTSIESDILQHWIAEFQDQDQCLFPILNDGSQEVSSRCCRTKVKVPTHDVLREFSKQNDIHLCTIFQTAWALVLRSYTGLEDVVFGYEEKTYFLPRHVTISSQSTLKSVLDHVDSSFTNKFAYKLDSENELLGALNTGDGGLFNSTIHFTDIAYTSEENGDEERLTKGDSGPSHDRLLLEIRVQRDRVRAQIIYHTSLLSEGQAANVGAAIEMAILRVLNDQHKSIREQSLFSDFHQNQVREWNAQRPETLHLTLHEAVNTQVIVQPDALAVIAWDEQWTFREVDVLSSTLAHHLVAIGVTRGDKIPLLFEKSGWWLIALLAVSKAAAVFVLMDPSQPGFRLREILSDLGSSVLLSSDQNRTLLSDSVKNVVVVSKATLNELNTTEHKTVLPVVCPEDDVYVMYTSGSTGRPKGAVLQHGGYMASLLRWEDDTRLRPGSRMLQNASYAWSVSIIEAVTSLWFGACLCIPSDADKQNRLTHVLNDMRITHAMLSPSISKTIDRNAVKYLESLTLTGEPVSQETVLRWVSKTTRVWVGWGATEALSLARSSYLTEGSDVQNLGRCKAVCRVSEVGNPDKQVPIGAVGEIIVHAPWIAKGYLNDSERSSSAFLDRPDWLDGKPSSYGSRWFRTLDCVRQCSDGTMMLAGRGDNMVKIRGQRFDMSEVERCLGFDTRIRNSLPIVAKSGFCKYRLVAIIALQDFSTSEEGVEELELLGGAELQSASRWVDEFQKLLADRVPSFMIPSIWMMVKRFPLTITGKIDRISLKRYVEKMDIDTFELVSSLGVAPDPPVTPMELRLQEVWSSVLQLPKQKIGRNQSFISLGGDSILGMLVGSRCSDQGLDLKLGDILRYGTIEQLAGRIGSREVYDLEKDTNRTKFEALRASILSKLDLVTHINREDIQDAYPASPMQQGMLLSKARTISDYNTSVIYELSPGKEGYLPEVDLLLSSWQQVVTRHDVLRTIFVECIVDNGTYYQIVLRDYDVGVATSIATNVQAATAADVVAYFNEHPPKPYNSRQPPHNLTIIQTVSNKVYCRLNAEHTIVDGTSVAVIVRDLSLAYHGKLEAMASNKYAMYVERLQQVVCSVDNKFWKTYLEGMNPCIMPNLTYTLSRDPVKVGFGAVEVEIKEPQHLLKFCQHQDITISALFRTIWGLVLRAYTGLDEVAFGYITSGRDLDIPGIGEIVGIFINMLVCRMNIANSSVIKDTITKAQKDYQDSLPHQHASLAQIQHILGLYGQQLFNTSMTVLKVVPWDAEHEPIVKFKNIHDWSPNEYDVDVQCWVSSAHVKVELWHRTERVSVQNAHNLATTFAKTLESIMNDPEQRVGRLDMFSQHHEKQILQWNGHLPEPIDRCLHEIISSCASQRPNEIAIHSWEREMTWEEVETASDDLACELIALGVVPEAHVLLCFEKCALAIVAMLAVLKAGGVCVSLDPAHPISRLQKIADDTSPLCCLTSTLHRGLFIREELKDSVGHILHLEYALLDKPKPSVEQKKRPQSNVKPDNAAFILFTSGSTGVPKGIIHTHSTIASSLHAHGQAMCIGADARTLQFSAFVFDVSVTEIFMSLTRGGVLCIPSDHERMNDLESAIVRMNANWAHLTPTVASLLDPGKVPCLRNMALAGEPLKRANIVEWAPRLNLINLYGPAECALATTLRPALVQDDRTDNIGKAYGLLLWIVDPADFNRLTPIGAVGEILLEGPNVARGYLKDKSRTVQSFVENPIWLGSARTTPPRRYYRAGDCARLNSDGSIQILGRIDMQVKLHGQRVELGEIEYQVKVGLTNSDIVNIAVIYAKSADQPGGGLLAAFLEFAEKHGNVDDDNLILQIPKRLRKVLFDLDNHLAESLPSYMIPVLYLPINEMPLLTAGKIDRGRLNGILAKFDASRIAPHSLSETQTEKAIPATKMERLLQTLWADVLRVERKSIGVHDSFFRLGADSVVAMRLAAATREAGITLAVTDIFKNPKLVDMARAAKPYSERLLQELKLRYQIPRSAVQDLYPATPLQEGLMASSCRQPGTYIARHVFRIPTTVDLDIVTRSWEIVHLEHAILRTRIAHIQGSITSMQVVMDDSIEWNTAPTLKAYLDVDENKSMYYGEALSRYGVVTETDNGIRYIVWTAHHSIFDEWTRTLLIQRIAEVYEKLSSGTLKTEPANCVSYKIFANKIFDLDVSTSESFWREQVSNLNCSPYPKLSLNHEPLADKLTSHSIRVDARSTSSELSTVVRAAWALLLAQYSETPDSIVFGETLHERSSSDRDVVGPTFGTVPVVVSIDRRTTVMEFLETIAALTQMLRTWQHLGLQKIKELGNDAAEACNFQSILAIHPHLSHMDTNRGEFYDSVKVLGSASTYLLLLECFETEKSLELTAQYDANFISAVQMQRMLQQLEHLVRQLMFTQHEDNILYNLSYCTPADAQTMLLYNQNMPAPLHSCVHDVISAYASTQSNRPAVVSGSSSTDYRQLDELSSKLAHYLATHVGVGPEILVPLCFSRNIYVIIAMLAVLKAGGAYVPMDPAHPPSRLGEIVKLTRSPIVLCSPEYEELGRTIADRAVVIDRKFLDACRTKAHEACSTVTHENACYVIFTSGSTGTPKGSVMTHSGFATAAKVHGERVNLNSESRVIHFSSYAFEACILEILTTLFNGGCVCVAPESERLEDIAKAMRDLRVNWAFFTPSFVRTIQPHQVPDLKTLVLGGEALGADNIDVWVDNVYLINGYGPSETCVFSVINEHITRGYTTPDMIGSPIGGACWIVDPEDHGRLMPLGATGELLIEGPTLARGYLDDPIRTNQAFVDNSDLVENIRSQLGDVEHEIVTYNTEDNGVERNSFKALLANAKVNARYQVPLNGQSTVVHRAYKTGDLVKWDTSGVAEGTIRFVGRKDQQIKVRGQRMETGDVEHHLKVQLPTVRHIVVEQVLLPGRDTKQLASFFASNGKVVASSAEDLAAPMMRDFRDSIIQAETSLNGLLPSYMLPSLWITLAHMPLLSSGKTNRRGLQEFSKTLSEQQIREYSLVDDDQKREASTETEKKLVDAWRRVLHIEMHDTIGLDDNFFRRGGDSIAAMHLTTAARENGITLSVTKIFQNPQLEKMAASATLLGVVSSTECTNFSLLGSTDDAAKVVSKVVMMHDLSLDSLEDAYPTSALQEGLFILSKKHPGSYMSQITLTLQPDVDIAQFKSAWQMTAERNPILRTRIIHVGTQTLQYVVSNPITWSHGSSLSTYLEHDKTQIMDYGDPLVRFALVEACSERHFVLTTHHSLYDGWSLSLIMEEFNMIYQNARIKPAAPKYANFISHLVKMDKKAARSFWEAQFLGKELSTFPEPHSVTQAPVETQISRFAHIQRPRGSDITVSSVIRSAWGIVVAEYCATSEVFFGAITTGRNASLPQIECMTGPTITTVPVCISIDKTEEVGAFLARTQQHATDMIPFEHTGLQTIKSFGSNAEKACNFQNLLVIQPEGSEDMNSKVWKEKVLFAKGEMVTMTYALIVECRLYKDQIRITAQYRENIIPAEQMQRIVHQFEHVLHQLNNTASDKRLIGTIEVVSDHDRMEIRQWNSRRTYTRVEECVHHLIEKQALMHPHVSAIESWDKNFTYEQLDATSTTLAKYLKSIGVGPNSYVPLCFDKCAWTIVAILAVMKAGGAYVALDPKHPKVRQQQIIHDVSAAIILTSAEYDCDHGRPDDAAFIVFTSGSTGVQKGIVMEHGAFVTSAMEHAEALDIGPQSRVMQFAAYTYDVSMGEILTTLMHGGCICVPNEEERLGNLSEAINNLRVNWIFLTPTVAGFLKPHTVPGLQTLVLGGEHATAENFQSWSAHLNLINSYGMWYSVLLLHWYFPPLHHRIIVEPGACLHDQSQLTSFLGPAECAIWCCRATDVTSDGLPANIGGPVGANLWITDPVDANKLSPIGCVGELLVEGPTLAREYLNDPVKTAAAFTENPAWATVSPGERRRFYRTGDLVRYGSNGDIHFVGRRDTQVKLHGQRIELGDIEQSLLKSSPADSRFVVELLHFKRFDSDVVLAAFIHIRESYSANEVETPSKHILAQMTSELAQSSRRIQDDVRELLPRHMIPTLFIPLRRVPLTAGGKTDRKALRLIGENLTQEEVLSFMLSDSNQTQPLSTNTERKLQDLWSRILKIDKSNIGADSNFLRLGGDSVAAMRLSAIARDEEHLNLSIKSIFTCARLDQMALVVEPIASMIPVGQNGYTPFATINENDRAYFLNSIIRPQVLAEVGEIEDIVEATDYQRWTQGCGHLPDRGYNNYFIFHFEGLMNHERLQHACQRLIEQHAVLRSCFIPHKEKLYHIIMKHMDPEFTVYDAPGDSKDFIQSLLANDLLRPVRFVTPTVRFLFVRHDKKSCQLLMRASHSCYDGISLPLIVRDLKANYLGQRVSPSRPFQQFVSGTQQTLSDIDAEQHWRSMLQGSTMTHVVEQRGPAWRNPINSSLKQIVPALPHACQDFTFATVVKAAWSLTLAQFSSVSDVVFGQITTGRHGPIEGINDIVGPCMNLVPVRIDLAAVTTCNGLLNQVQSQHLDMLKYESFGMQKIVEKCTSWPKWERYSSILQHTNFNIGMNATDGWGDIKMHLGNFTPEHDVADIWIWTSPSADENFLVELTYSDRTIPPALATEILGVLCKNIISISDLKDIVVNVTCSDRSQARFPLSCGKNNMPDTQLIGSTAINSDMLRVVERVWTMAFADENDALLTYMDKFSAFFEVRGDILVAGQLSELYVVEGYHFPSEDILEHPTMQLQALFLSRSLRGIA